MLSTLAPKLIEPTRWLIVLGIAVTLAQTVLFFISGPAGAAGASSSRPAARAPAAQRSAVSVDTIIARNLFGVASTTAQAAVTQPAQETRLPLELRGVFVGETPETSAAIVAQKGKAGELYNVGDVVPGNAELVEVHPGHVVLRRAGNLETLTFPDVTQLVASAEGGGRVARPSSTSFFDDGGIEESFDDGQVEGFARGAPQPSQPRGAGAPGTPREFIDSYRSKLDENPEDTLSELGIAPVSAGSSQGYRLGNLAQSPYLSQTGLQPGDVVLSVNGSAVGDIRQDRQQIDSILEQGSARLEIQRGTRRFFVTTSLK